MKKKEQTSAKLLSLEASLWKWLEQKAQQAGVKNSQQFIAAELRKLKASEAQG